MKPAPNAICLGGPCHGMLTHIRQDVGVLDIPLPTRPSDDPEETARYRITVGRVHHPSSAEPFIILRWADSPPGRGFSSGPAGRR
ncbi:hypothetical protein AB0K60_21000 [Thermopolyspora sp. NPDC052614]|uniref:hypothetical protein n=1 Tax=Thermopolyspora sp. NPDC052614 TaxID=3155682 RepID=UPI00343BA7E3